MTSASFFQPSMRRSVLRPMATRAKSRAVAEFSLGKKHHAPKASRDRSRLEAVGEDAHRRQHRQAAHLSSAALPQGDGVEVQVRPVQLCQRLLPPGVEVRLDGPDDARHDALGEGGVLGLRLSSRCTPRPPRAEGCLSLGRRPGADDVGHPLAALPGRHRPPPGDWRPVEGASALRRSSDSWPAGRVPQPGRAGRAPRHLSPAARRKLKLGGRRSCRHRQRRTFSRAGDRAGNRPWPHASVRASPSSAHCAEPRKRAGNSWAVQLSVRPVPHDVGPLW
jgi:hypothetical protein